VWHVEGIVPEHLRRAIAAHLKQNCQFEFDGECELRGDPLAFYEDTLLCELMCAPGTRIRSGRRRQQIEVTRSFYFLFKNVAGDEVLIPLTGDRGDILLANRWLNRRLDGDEQRLDYARFFYAFARTEVPPCFHNVPRRMAEVRFARPASETQIWGVYGAMWRFLDPARLLHVRVAFERRGLPWRTRHQAHLPLQIGNEIFDVDLKIWADDGQITYRKAELVYRDQALAAEPQERPGKIVLPRYVKWGERLVTLCENAKAHIYQAIYLATTSLFIVASAIALAVTASVWGQRLLHLTAETIGFGNWATWLMIACFYCITYFALTTLLILDAEKVRNGLRMWSRRFAGSWIDQVLHGWILKRRRRDSGFRHDLWRRIVMAVFLLAFWTAYLVVVFTSLQVAFRPQLASDVQAMLEVMRVLAEQALLYIPLVFYYVGRKWVDAEKHALIAPGIMVTFQFMMGLLVIRRVHRFWAGTASSRLS
jgi:hypothetical protein